MITKNNFPLLLEKLGFETHNKIYSKKIHGFTLKADFSNQKLIYPEGLTADRDTTKNFSQPENFVVFECVHNLLESGYKPEHIILEQGMPGGHGMTGGFCDIIVQDNDKKPYLLIECKTADGDKSKEFSRAWVKMQKDGGQLFNYYNSYRQAQWLCLYSSDFNENPEQIYHLISMKDNEEYLKSNAKFLSFKQVQNNNGGKDQYFKVWTETYQQDYISHNLFESEAFNIGNRPYNVDDLKIVDNNAIQKKYHQFATIMRQHNVSARENAFDKLVNLFLCKVVDEGKYPTNLEFYWKGAASDNHYDLQDRLQRLYKMGMEEFLGEDVTYISEAELENAFRLFKDRKDTTKETVLKQFKKLKYYSNNPFAFLDVHNEKLFFQNAVILKEIVQMLQDIRLKNEQEQHQFLGDLFEGFLDQGVKQSEGQFFTPMPIVKFLISSLPLVTLLENEKTPKVIDYACGAGHFLTEYANQIKPLLLAKNKNPSDFYRTIYGIEKEYRLSKVAKVSAFMYGQDEMNIVYADALAQNQEQEKTKELADGTFSLLVANPPYSVKGFLSTLTEEDKAKFTLNQYIDNEETFNSIETFFVEKAAKLLQQDGIAVIVLPSSILTNGNIYVKCREILLQYFDLVAIAEFGSGTFGKTGTNTATLFLRRKSRDLDLAEHYQNRVDAWFEGSFIFDGLFEDVHLLKAYCQHCGFEFEQYQAFLKAKEEMPTAMEQLEIFAEYRKAFDKKKLPKSANVKLEWLKFVKEIEKDKLRFFMLAQDNGQDVLVVKMPTENKDKKAFLGYEWSSAKGNEGIKYLTNQASNSDDALENARGINYIQTPLFNPNNLFDETKINSLIRQHFATRHNQSAVQIPEDLSDFVSLLPLTKMLDFGRTIFDKEIRTNVQHQSILVSHYPIVKLGDVCNILIGGTPSRKVSEYFTGVHLWVSISEIKSNVITDTKEKITDLAIRNSNVKLIPKGTTLLSFKLSIGRTAIAGTDLYTNEAIAGLLPIDKNIILDNYIYHLFNGKLIDLENVGNKAFGKSLNSAYLKDEVKIPLPPLDIQKKIIEECEKVDNEYETSRMKIEEYRAKIANIFNELEVIFGGVKRFRINELCLNLLAGGDKPEYFSERKTDKYQVPVIANGSENFGIVGYTDKAKITDKSVTISARGTIGYSVVRYEPYFPIVRLVVAIVNEELITTEYFKYAIDNVDYGSTGSVIPQLTVPYFSNVEIPVPDLEKQNKIVADISTLEKQISELEAKMALVSDKKKAILQKYL